MSKFAPAQGQDLTLGPVEFHEVLMSLSRLPVSFWMASFHSSTATQLSAVSKPAEAALHPTADKVTCADPSKDP